MMALPLSERLLQLVHGRFGRADDAENQAATLAICGDRSVDARRQGDRRGRAVKREIMDRSEVAGIVARRTRSPRRACQPECVVALTTGIAIGSMRRTR